MDQKDATQECWKCSSCGGIRSHNMDDSGFRRKLNNAAAFLDWTTDIDRNKENEFIQHMKENQILTDQDFDLSETGWKMALHGVLADRCDVAREFVAYFVTET